MNSGKATGRRSLLKALVGCAAAAAAGKARAVFASPREITFDEATASDCGCTIHAPMDSASRLRRWGMVIDLRRCDGCQSVNKPPQCTEACIQGHYAPKPMEWIQVYEADLPGGGTQFIPAPCMQCQNPPCTNVCPVAATFSTPEGPVLIDHQRCIGCRMCMEACPYDRRFFVWGNPPVPAEAEYGKYDVERQTPAVRGTTMKCDFCMDLTGANRRPHCVEGCPNGAIYSADLEEDLATNGIEVVQFSGFLRDNSAYRLREELGTEPRVYYIPGHGELVSRDPFKTGRKATEWPWQDAAPDSADWNRTGPGGHW